MFADALRGSASLRSVISCNFVLVGQLRSFDELHARHHDRDGGSDGSEKNRSSSRRCGSSGSKLSALCRGIVGIWYVGWIIILKLLRYSFFVFGGVRPTVCVGIKFSGEQYE